MSSNEEKRERRLEKKRRKAEAFLAVAELNDVDGGTTAKRRKLENGKETSGTDDQLLLQTKVEPPLLTDKPPVSGDEFTALKERLRERKKARRCLPNFRLKAVGEEAIIRPDQVENRIPLFMSDIQSLLTYCLCGDRAPYWPHRWCTLEKWNRLSNVVCVILEGVGTQEVAENGSELSWLAATMPLLEVVSPASYSSSVVEDLALIPVSARHRRKLIQDYGNLETAVEKNQAFKTVKAVFPIKNDAAKDGDTPNKQEVEEELHLKLRLLLNAQQMVMENYPLPLDGRMKERYKDYLLTSQEYSEVHANSPLYSIDCEMCFTERGMELTRVCVVNERLDVVYHTFVKPHNQITNYLTQYSGVTKEMLEDVTTRLSDVQDALRSLLPSDAILVGQSLNSDLDALRMMHPYVIDTSVIYNLTGDRRRKSKLSALASFFLNKEIQTGGRKGHNPEEDAKAAMSLVLKKLEQGYHFGDVLLGGQVPNLDQDGLYVVEEKEEFQLVSTITRTVNDNEKTVGLAVSSTCSALYDQFPNFRADVKTFETGADYKEVLERAKTLALDHNLSITHVDLTTTTTAAKACRRADRVCRELYRYTSTNGLFVAVLAGGPANNAAVGVTLCAPPQQDPS